MKVDGKEPGKYPARAILDILLTIGGKNMILLELKKEGLSLTGTDIEQGISYARLLHPMPPLTLISNGTDNRFFNTYTREQINTTHIDLNVLQQLTDSSFALAQNDFRQAIEVILNRDPELFSKVINQISEKRFQRISGELTDYLHPICPTFSIPRKCLEEVDQHFADNAKIVGLVGHAFSGKTNILYQFFRNKKSDSRFLLYLDCSDHNIRFCNNWPTIFQRTPVC